MTHKILCNSKLRILKFILFDLISFFVLIDLLYFLSVKFCVWENNVNPLITPPGSYFFIGFANRGSYSRGKSYWRGGSYCFIAEKVGIYSGKGTIYIDGIRKFNT